MNVEQEIFKLIYDESLTKFVKDSSTKSTKINPSYTRVLKEFDAIKDLVCNTADKNA